MLQRVNKSSNYRTPVLRVSPQFIVPIVLPGVRTEDFSPRETWKESFRSGSWPRSRPFVHYRLETRAKWLGARTVSGWPLLFRGASFRFGKRADGSGSRL